MEKQSFNPEWMNDPEMLRNVIREQMLEYGEVVHQQAEKIKSYERTLKEIGEMPKVRGIGVFETKYNTMIEKALISLRENKEGE